MSRNTFRERHYGSVGTDKSTRKTSCQHCGYTNWVEVEKTRNTCTHCDKISKDLNPRRNMQMRGN